MRRMCVFVGVAAAALSVSASAETVVTISKSQQRLAVTVDGAELYRWPVSTGRRGLDTPSGTFRPIRFERKWYSRKYDMSPMPYSVFFHGGYAMHGTYEKRRLGHPASHGCVRMLPVNAATLFDLLRKQGKGNARIVVTNGPLPSPGFFRPFAKNVPLPQAAPDGVMTAIKLPMPAAEIAVPLPAEYTPQFDAPKMAASKVDVHKMTMLAAALPVALPSRGVPLPQKRAATEADIVVPLPPEHAPEFAALPQPAQQALASIPLPQVRAPEARPAPRQVKQEVNQEVKLVREAHAQAGVAGRQAFTSVGSEAEVLRGRAAWLRDLDRQYRIR
jgi:hypothetical protein